MGVVHWDEGTEPHSAVGPQECSLAERMPPKMGITGHRGNLKSSQEHETGEQECGILECLVRISTEHLGLAGVSHQLTEIKLY